MLNRAGATSPSTKRSGSEIIDPEFGRVVCRRTSGARYVRVRVGEDGAVRASLPKRAPLYMVQELLDSSRDDIRKLIAAQKAKLVVYRDGMQIGHSHRLRITFDAGLVSPKKRFSNQEVIVTLPGEAVNQEEQWREYISSAVRRALRREAEAYLPRRLRYLAETYGFVYARERFGNQTGRWGSCSSSGTISLNVALMNLPHEIIDYVLIHELAHTRQMNHSDKFWTIVEMCMPEYRQHRKILKTMSPIC